MYSDIGDGLENPLQTKPNSGLDLKISPKIMEIMVANYAKIWYPEKNMLICGVCSA